MSATLAPTPRLLGARNAVAVSFLLNGLSFATWVSRIPATRDRLSLGNAGLGLLLLCLSVGSLAALPASGALVSRLGTAAGVRLGVAATTTGLLLVSLGAGVLASVPVTGLGLLAYGAGSGVWDVSMNVEGADVERRLGRTILPRFHAAFSLGTVIGAGLGAVAVLAGVPTAVHLPLVGAGALVWALGSARRFLVPVPDAAPAEGEPAAGRPRAAWTEPRTLLIGLVVLALALTEGTANDWLAVALKDGYAVPGSVAVLGFGGFVAAMTLGRVVGPVLLDRYGRVVVLRGTMLLAVAGVLLIAFGGGPALVVPGIALWGLGASLGFPVGISAAADDPDRASARVGVVSTIGYAAFLAGPPLVGFVGEEVGTLRSLLVVCAVLLPAALVVPVTRRVPVG